MPRHALGAAACRLGLALVLCSSATSLWAQPFVAQPLPAVPIVFADASSQLPPFTHSGVGAGGDGFGGAAWFDCDNDGRLDLFLTNGRGQNNALFRNTNGGFVDISVAAGVQNGQGNGGVIAADIDNDGWQDVFLTGDGGFFGDGDSPIKLYRNNGACSFTDITAASGLVAPITHLSATFGDIDNDGYLDLFVGASGSFCRTGHPACVPGNHPNKLYRNNGNLTFTDITATAGVGTALGACAGFFGHYDNDPYIDLFVANCNLLTPPPAPVFPVAAPNELYRNNGNGTFTNIAPTIGLTPQGFFMGVAPADIDNDLQTDVFVSNTGNALPAFQHAWFYKAGTLCPTPAPSYVNVSSFLINPTQEFGWGATAQDFNNDTWTDLFFAGALPQVGFIGPGPTGGNPGTLLFNRLPTNVVFDDQTASLPASVNLANKFSSGVAAADYDNDGDVDLVIQTDTYAGVGGAPVLLRNRGNVRHWLRVRLRGTTSNRDGIGARIAVGIPGVTQLEEVYAGSSFLSMDSQWPTFGLDTAAATTLLGVWWPSGLIETYPNVAANQTITLVEGNGTPFGLNCP